MTAIAPCRTSAALNAPTVLTVNLDHIRENLERIKAFLPQNTRIMAIIKANAYGTCSSTIARYLKSCGIEIFGVAYPDEGLKLREEGFDGSIFVSHTAPFEAEKIVRGGLESSVSDSDTIDSIAKEAAKAGAAVPLHLYINTGMNRCGCRPEDSLKLAQKIQSSPHLSLAGAMTHFASAEEKHSDAFTHKQYEKFQAAIHAIQKAGIPLPCIHTDNSSASLRFSFPLCNMKRIGLALYGLYLSEPCKEALPLKPALALTTRIAALHECRRGETISYGRTYTATKKKEIIAVLPIGYYDGLHRHYSNKGYVVIHGKTAPQVGRICMDYMMVDVTEIPDAKIGDRAEIFGENLPVEKVASWGNTIAHELICCLGPRIERKFTFSE